MIELSLARQEKREEYRKLIMGYISGEIVKTLVEVQDESTTDSGNE